MTSQTATLQPAPATDPRAFKSFAEFYPFYLSEHSNRTCRRLHFIRFHAQPCLCLAMLLVTGKLQYLLYGPALRGYGFAWVGALLALEEEQTCQFQAAALQLHGRLGDVPGHLDGEGGVLKH